MEGSKTKRFAVSGPRCIGHKDTIDQHRIGHAATSGHVPAMQLLADVVWAIGASIRFDTTCPRSSIG